MKRLTSLLATILIAATSWSQPSQLIIHGEAGKLYLEHTVSAKENWYSIGRLYNISPKEIAPFNGLAISKPLEIGQLIKIPLKPLNFSQNESKAANETLVPVYHIIKEKEWLYHISTTYNKVPVETLEKWNHINKDQAKAGMQLIVGYLKVKTAQSALANSSIGNTVAVEPASTDKDKSTASNANQYVSSEKKTDPVIKKQDASVSHEPAVTTSASALPAQDASQINTYAASHSTGGFFSIGYNSSNTRASGQAGTFKSTSGWHDGKYYALINNVPVGTIVKVTSPLTNKSVFAKVLGQLPDMKESTGLTIRISNAAAAELGTGEGKFPVDIKY